MKKLTLKDKNKIYRRRLKLLARFLEEAVDYIDSCRLINKLEKMLDKELKRKK